MRNDNIIVSVVYPYITLTNFEENTIRDSVDAGGEEEDGSPFHAGDTAEYVAHRILEAIESGEAEIFAHDWMGKRAR